MEGITSQITDNNKPKTQHQHDQHTSKMIIVHNKCAGFQALKLLDLPKIW
jgi:hypothetical protein